jgi:hypothetical protein
MALCILNLSQYGGRLSGGGGGTQKKPPGSVTSFEIFKKSFQKVSRQGCNYTREHYEMLKYSCLRDPVKILMRDHVIQDNFFGFRV